jgi:colanic acid/amylovoran biosynthesis glycosyltransferase
MQARRTLIVYRDELLGPSETFIRAQGESLDRFRALYVGARRTAGLQLPDLRVHIMSEDGWVGRLQRARFKLLGPSAALRAMLASDQPALVHAHFGPDACDAIALARALEVPLVVTFHGHDVTTSDKHLPYLYIRRRNSLKRFGARFICVSDFVRQQAIEKGFPPHKTVMHYTGIDTDLFCPHAGVPRLPIVLFVGRLVAKKGCASLIRAMARVQAVTPDVQLVVIGDGPLRPTLERQAAELLRNHEFLGVRSPEAVKEWMNRSALFCVPSQTAPSGDAEGFGMAFAEAQAMGLPVVSFASGGIPEIVADGQTGFLVREGDWQSLADKLLVLLSDKDLWLRFSKAGQSRVRARFDLWKQTSALEQIYDDVLAERSGAPWDVQVQREHGNEGDRQSLALTAKCASLQQQEQSLQQWDLNAAAGRTARRLG